MKPEREKPENSTSDNSPTVQFSPTAQSGSDTIPSLILPFIADANKCKECYKAWLKQDWFTPSELKKNAPEPNGFRQVYLPFYAFNADTHTYFKGKTADDSGEDTSYKKIKGESKYNFEHLLVPASDSEIGNMVLELQHWNFDLAVPYKDGQFPSIGKEQATKSFTVSRSEAYERMDQLIEGRIKQQMGGSNQTIQEKEVSYENETAVFVYLPVWVSSFTYKEKKFEFIADGTTGEVSGNSPISKAKATLFWIILAAIILIIAYIVTSSSN